MKKTYKIDIGVLREMIRERYPHWDIPEGAMVELTTPCDLKFHWNETTDEEQLEEADYIGLGYWTLVAGDGGRVLKTPSFTLYVFPSGVWHVAENDRSHTRVGNASSMSNNATITERDAARKAVEAARLLLKIRALERAV